MQLMVEIQYKTTLEGLLFTAKTHMIEQIANDFLESNAYGRGGDFHSHDITSLKWAINDEFNLGMTIRDLNQWTWEFNQETTEQWQKYLEERLSDDGLIDYVIQNIDWQNHQPVDQHPTICVMDQQDSTHELNKENTLYVIGRLKDVQLLFVGQHEKTEYTVEYEDLGFSKPVALNQSMLKSDCFLERLLSCCAVNGLPLKADRTATQANYQSLLGMDEKTFQTLEPFLFHNGYAERHCNDAQLTRKLIVQAAASSQNLLHPSFIDQLNIKSLPTKFEDRSSIRSVVEKYHLFSWYVSKLINQDLLKDEIDGINQGPVNFIRRSFLRENLAYSYWQGAFDELGSSVKQEVEDDLKGIDAISHMNHGFSSALDIAVKQNNMGIIQHFIERGSQKNQILLSVIYNEGYTFAKQLIESGADINEKASKYDVHIIAIALALNNTNMVRFIVEQPSFSLENTRSTEQKDLLHWAIKNDHPETLKKVFEIIHTQHPKYKDQGEYDKLLSDYLLYAMENAKPEVSKTLMQMGAGIEPILNWQIQNDRPATLKKRLEIIHTQHPKYKDQGEYDKLLSDYFIKAIEISKPSIIQALFEARQGINQTIDQQPSVHQRFDVNIKAPNGKSLLSCICKNEQLFKVMIESTILPIKPKGFSETKALDKAIKKYRQSNPEDHSVNCKRAQYNIQCIDYSKSGIFYKLKKNQPIKLNIKSTQNFTSSQGFKSPDVKQISCPSATNDQSSELDNSHDNVRPISYR
jgi:hypothetical protein